MKHVRAFGQAAEIAFVTRSPSGRRRTERVPVALEGRMQTLHGSRAVRLHDLSRWGTMVEGAPPSVRRGSEMILNCEKLDVFGTVIWADDTRCGVRFEAPIKDELVEALWAMSEPIDRQPPPA